jgi:hypothetical protein
MKLERSDIKFPLWRKKVDSSLFNKLHTPIPNWCAKAWNLSETFGKNTSKKMLAAEVKIKFKKQLYSGWVTYSHNKDVTYQLFLSKEIVEELKDIFVMSYMRSLEMRLRKNDEAYKDLDIEQEVPFWEFIDVEFDNLQKTFLFKDHYSQKAIFPALFKQFIRSHLLKDIENSFLNKGDFKFIKEDWISRKDSKNFLQRHNIIYYLIDTKNRLLYIGEGEHTKRIFQLRKEIAEWDYFRVDCLPEWLTKSQRLEIERLIIRSFASLLINKKNINTKRISDFTLINLKIDL